MGGFDIADPDGDPPAALLRDWVFLPLFFSSPFYLKKLNFGSWGGGRWSRNARNRGEGNFLEREESFCEAVRVFFSPPLLLRGGRKGQKREEGSSREPGSRVAVARADWFSRRLRRWFPSVVFGFLYVAVVVVVRSGSKELRVVRGSFFFLMAGRDGPAYLWVERFEVIAE